MNRHQLIAEIERLMDYMMIGFGVFVLCLTFPIWVPVWAYMKLVGKE